MSTTYTLTLMFGLNTVKAIVDIEIALVVGIKINFSFAHSLDRTLIPTDHILLVGKVKATQINFNFLYTYHE